MEERFTYDWLNRLTGVIENGDTTGVFVYDDYGRMTMKRLHGEMVFDSTAYGTDGRPHALERATVYAEQPEQWIRYTSFDMLQSIEQTDPVLLVDCHLSYDYGYDHRRIRMTEALSLDTIVKEYVGNCEFVRTNGSVTSERTLLSGPLGVFAVLDSHILPVGKGMYYVHPDHLGSWTTVTNRNGAVVQDVWFDPWGTPYYSDSATLTQAHSLLFDRGFTGHEHMAHFGLINMNGRVYDPVTSTFLSVDNYVQDPSYTQNFNRYSYCLNNPLKYTDPDGEEFITSAIIIGGVILGAYTGGTLANGGNFNPVLWNWKNPATIIGIIGGGITGGLSSWAGIAIAGAGFSFCNTAAIASSSFAYSLGMHGTGLLAGFDYDVSLSIGLASYNFSNKEFGYLFKKGNSIMDNIGYGLGAITNICDIYRFATWDILSKQQRYDKAQRWAEKHHGETNMDYNSKMNATGTYDLKNDKIQLSDLALSEDFGWAKSSYLHELNHRNIMLPYKKEIERLSSLVAQGKSEAAVPLAKFYAAFDSFAYETELINAAKNGLSLDQFQRLNSLYLYYSEIGQRTGGDYNYSLWNLLKNILLP